MEDNNSKPNEDSKAITAEAIEINVLQEYIGQLTCKLSEANSENARLQSQLAESNQRGDNLYALLNDACNQLTESTFYNKCKQALYEYESTKPNF